MPKLKFEKLDVVNTISARVSRAKIPGGCLLIVTSNSGGGLTFYSDPQHKWDGNSLNFKVIRWIYKNPGCTRLTIWRGVHGAMVREDSAEADMFKLLIRDLSTGSVIRQHREKDYYGNFIKKTSVRSGRSSQTMKSAFDKEETYELTELGKQFVRYTMDEVMPRIAAPRSEGSQTDSNQSPRS